MPRRGLIVFDELHKYGRWRNLIKGLYDRHHEGLRILVTGSAGSTFTGAAATRFRDGTITSASTPCP